MWILHEVKDEHGNIVEKHIYPDYGPPHDLNCLCFCQPFDLNHNIPRSLPLWSHNPVH